MENHLKGTDYYEMTSWLLDHYIEFRYYRLELADNTAAGGEFGIDDISRYMETGSRNRYMSCFSGDDLKLTANLADAMDRACEKYGKVSRKRAEMLRRNFMDFDYQDIPVYEKIEKMGYTNCGYYKAMYKAVSEYSPVLWEELRSDRGLPFFASSPRESLKLIGIMQTACGMHDYGGRCFKDTESLLKKYIDIKYVGVQDKLTESGMRISENYGLGGSIVEFYNAMDQITSMNVDDKIKGWLYSSMAENTGAYVHLIDSAAQSMRKLGAGGEENYEYIRTMFMDPQYMGSPWNKRMEALNLSQRVYYLRRNKAIEMLSKVLWGPLSHRHTDSVFYSSMRRFS